MWVADLVLSPIGRKIAFAVVILVLIFGWRAEIQRGEAIAIQHRESEDALNRIQKAISAGRALRLDPERLRDPDRYIRAD